MLSQSKIKFEKAYEEYKTTKISLTQLKKKYNICRGDLSKYIKSKGYEVINYQNLASINETYFENIDTEEKAYWLGFMYADGYVSDERNAIELSLQPKDINHLHKFSKAIDSKKDPKLFTTRCRLVFVNKKFRENLIKQGCIAKKSLILKAPNINPKFIKHFIRGYFDGDGCLRFPLDWNKTKRCYHRPIVSILGTRDILNYILNNFDPHLNKNFTKNSKTNDITLVLSLEDKNARNFLKYIYEDCSIYLDRKFEKYMLFKNCPIQL